MVEALCRPGQPGPAPANTDHAQEALGLPRNGLCSQGSSPAQLQGHLVAHVSLGERLSHLKGQEGDS